MSLVSEALRKARQEAAEREARDRGLVVPPGLHRPQRGRRRGPSTPAFVLIAAAAAGLGAAGAWWFAGGRAPAVAAAGPVAAVAGPLHSSADGRGPALAAPRPGFGQPEAAPTTAPAATAPPRAPSAVAGDVGRDRAPARPTAAASTPPEAPPSPPGGGGKAGPEVTGATGERVFVGRAELGYATLDLDFLVAKPDAPFGRINGEDVVVGSIVDGFVVEKITADHVVLRDRHGTVVLRVR